MLIGTNDLMMEKGLPGQFGHPEVARAYQQVIEACRKHGKWPGMGGVYGDELLAKYVGLGMRMIIAGNDLGMMMAGGAQRAQSLRRQPRDR